MATKLRKLGRWGGPSPRQVGAFAFLAFLGLEVWPGPPILPNPPFS